jgi:hydrogenase nickel incorporation protein HypA/HybF
MHELSITENILEIALRHGEQADAKKITDLYLVIGQLSSIIDDSVQFYWDIIAAGTKAEGAQLHFNRIQTRLRCTSCKHEYFPASEDLACPICSNIRVDIISGDEFYFDAIDVET